MSLLERFRIYFKQLPLIRKSLLVLAFVIVIIILVVASTLIIIGHTIGLVGSRSTFANLDNAGELNFSTPSLNSIYELADEVGSDRPPTHELRQLQERNEICVTTECQTLAKDFLNSIDFTADPCADFYEFTCGQILNNEGNGNQTIKDAIDKLSNQSEDFLEELASEGDDDDDDWLAVMKARDFYRTCYNHSAEVEASSAQALRAMIESNGGWPLLLSFTDGGGTFDESNFDWMKVSAAYDHDLRSSAFLSVTVELDIGQSNQHIICIEEPDLSWLEYIGSYTITRVLLYLTDRGAKFSEYNTDSIDDEMMTKIERELADMTAFMEKLLSITDKTKSDLPKYSHEYLEYTYNKYSVDEFGMEIGLDLKAYIEQVFRSRLDWQWQPAGEQIIVRVPSYLQQLIPLIQKTEKRVLANLLHFFMAYKYLAEMDLLHRESFSYSFRKAHCQIETFHLFTLAAYYKMSEQIRQNTTNDAACGDSDDDSDEVASIRARVLDEMIGNQRHVFLEQITNSGFDSITVINASAKLIAMKAFVGTPVWLTSQMVEDYYQELNITGSTNSSHLVNLRYFNTWHMGKQVELLRAPADKDVRLESVLTSSLRLLIYAVYIFPLNAFVIPASLLREPVFSVKYPASINYGALGFLVAHEFSHGFHYYERQRLRIDAMEGLAVPISNISSTAHEEFHRRAECFKAQYEEFEPLPGKKINATCTLTEDLADNNGIRIAISAYQKHIQDKGTRLEQRLPGLEQFTHEQLFFIAFAHTWCGRVELEEAEVYLETHSHSPSKFRILGSLMNSQVFSNAWSCPSGSKMNPSMKCKMW